MNKIPTWTSDVKLMKGDVIIINRKPHLVTETSLAKKGDPITRVVEIDGEHSPRKHLFPKTFFGV